MSQGNEPEFRGLRPLSTNAFNHVPTGLMANEKDSSSILAQLNSRPKRVGFADSENQAPAVQPAARPARGRASLLGGLGDDLAKLRSEFDNLQQQLSQMPARRESGMGLDPGHRPMLVDHNQSQAGDEAARQALSTQPIMSQQSVPTQPMTAVPPMAPILHAQAAPVPAPVALCTFSASAADLAARAASMADCPLECKEGRGESLFQFPINVPSTSRAWKAAVDVFQDPELTALCEDGLSKQLQRTKDGATEQSRIQELAGLVKLLRKCVRELGSRSSLYVDQSIKVEKELLKQIETGQLSSESAIKALEAELAGAKKSLAGFEASFKADKASWGADLESARFESARLKRELERVTEERDRAREDSKRAEQSRQQLEMELKELRKAASQQMREVAVSQNETVRTISEEKAAAERREAGLREETARLSQRLDAANTCIEALQGELSLLQQVHDQVKDGLRMKLAAEESLTQQLSRAQSELASAQQQLSHAQARGDKLQTDLTASVAACEQLRGELSTVHSDLQTTKEMLAELSKGYDTDKAAWSAERTSLQTAWAEERAQLQAAISAATEHEASLSEEKAALKAALTSALQQKEEAEMAGARMAREASAFSNEIVNLKHEVEFVTGQQTAAEEKAAALQASLAGVEAALAATREELASKQERLSLLEGEFDALKEVLGDAGGQRDVVSGLLSRISTLQAAVASAEATRRKMHNELVSIRGNIRVYCRVKPHPSPVVRISPDQSSIAISVDSKDHNFSYDRVYAPGVAQEEVFSGVSELVQSALDGYHVCLFSYGQTGAGKTHTMQGTADPAGRGIIPRAVEKILETADRLREQCEWEYSMEASFVEVYNNALRDLLGGRDAPYINDQSAIKHDPAGGHTIVAGVNKVAVTDSSCADALIRRAAAARACEATAMNAESSRSHVVFMLYISGFHPPTGTRLQGCLCLVDLAGSERLDRSQAEDARKKEACAINQSLSALGDIFAALSAKSGHVPYRNSKLTYLLQPCLGGQGKTLMFVNINPEPASAFESLCSLKFAAKVNGCETGAKGGAKRNTMGGGAATLVPSQMAASSSAASGGGVGEGPKRLSLPGPPRAPAAMGAGADKRMSMYSGHGSSGAVGAGAKRPPAGPPSGMPPSGPAAKRTRQ